MKTYTLTQSQIDEVLNALDACFGVMMQPHLHKEEPDQKFKIGLITHAESWLEARREAEKKYYSVKDLSKYEVEPVREPDAAYCMDCGKAYDNFKLDIVLPKEQWLQINPEDGGLLCAQCIVDRASKIDGVVAIRAVLDFIPSVPSPDVKPVASHSSGFSNSIEQEVYTINSNADGVNALKEIINQYMNWHPTDLKMASAKYFVETGKVSGNFYLAIEEIAKMYHQLIRIKDKMAETRKMLNREQKAQECDTTKAESRHSTMAQNNSQKIDWEGLEKAFTDKVCLGKHYKEVDEFFNWLKTNLPNYLK